MKYLLMCCTEEKKLAGLSRYECDALMDETSAYCEALSKSGHLSRIPTTWSSAHDRKGGIRRSSGSSIGSRTA